MQIEEMERVHKSPLRNESERKREFNKLSSRIKEISIFLNTNWELIKKSEKFPLANLVYVKENIEKIMPLILEEHKSDDIIIFNNLEDKLGTFVMLHCGTIQRFLKGKDVSSKLLDDANKYLIFFSQYLQNILENKEFLSEELRSYGHKPVEKPTLH